MEVKVTHLDQVKFAIHARSHSIICDQPTDNGGADSGMTPPELLLASVGSCAAFYAVQYLKTRNLDDRNVEVTVSAEKLRHPSQLGNFVVQVSCPLVLTEEQTAGMTRSVHHCLVHNTLLTPSQIEVKLALGVAAPQQV